MYQHPFILIPGTWLGQGKIQLSMVSEELAYFTRWTIGLPDGDGRICCLQEIQLKGVADIMHNQFDVFPINNGEFAIDLENQALGRVRGKGIINEKLIAWEFRIEEIGFEGFEFYEKQEDCTYLMRAEYATTDQFRTAIQGQIWQQQKPATEELS